MKKIKLIQFKAGFLLTVFSLNTIIGFACSVGLDMDFNLHHHNDEEATDIVSHVHSDGKEHTHHEKKNNKDNCCNDKVTKIAQQEKAIPQSINISVPVFITAFISSFYDVNLLPANKVDSNIKYFVRSHHPPIPDVRVAIQSFQI